MKELIKYKGLSVAPAELEALLLTHPAVADAAVVRHPDGAAGEVPKAYVVRRDAVSERELMDWIAGRVAPYKRVRLVEFTDSIPRSTSGKILRRLLVTREGGGRNHRGTAMRTVTADVAGPRADEQDWGCDLRGTVAVISGGGRGVGRLMAVELAGAGAATGLIARSAAELTAVTAEIKRAGGTVAAVACDVSDEQATAAAVTELARRLGPATLLINNAGVSGPAGPLWEISPADWWRAFEVNIGGAFTLTRLLLPEMIAARGGRIINITSYAGVYRWPLMSAYATSKAALVKLTETLAEETRPHGVAVFSVDPGLLPIGLSESALSSRAAPQTPEGRVHGWIRDQLRSGHGADPAQATRLILALATGCCDRLSGRHLTATDDFRTLLAELDRIERDDLHTLRLREL